MKQFKILLWLVIIGFTSGTAYLVYKKFFVKKEKEWFVTEFAQRRTISTVIRSTGYLEAEDLLKIGSLVPGVIKKLLVEENDRVKSGTVLAIIDDGKDDTEVRESEGLLLQAKNDLIYATAYHKRQRALYDAGQLAQDTFEQITRDLENSKALVKIRQAIHDKAKLVFSNKTIKAPENGLIIQKVSTEGETVTLTAPATVIYTLAKDLSKIKVRLEIDENRVGEIKKGQVAILTFDTYPYKKFSGIITDISNAPIKKQTAVSYQATFMLDNKEGLLRPGMTVNARINVAEKENVLAVPGNIFAINSFLLQEIARITGYGFKPLPAKVKKELENKGAFKTLWIVENKTFIEKPVELGINDNAFFEVLSGLTGKEQIVSDVQEPDTMQKLYSQIFGKGL